MSDAFGLYVHVPFCSSRCDYCAFATWTNSENYFVDYFQALGRELDFKLANGTIREPSSLYIGGGTPSLVPGDLISNLLAQIKFSTDAEVTIECNPESTAVEKLKIYKDSGINRVSFGVQSTSRRTLESLGRHHDVNDIYRAVEALGQVGFENYSIDLIYGAAGERLRDVEKSLLEVLKFSPAPVHVSAYALTVEPGTPLQKDRNRYPDDDYQAAAYDVIDQILEDNGYRWYEISNWAKPGYYSRHNWNYWMQGEYAGVGCAAHSHQNYLRWSNIFNFKRYIDATKNGDDIVTGREETQDIVSEALELLARTSVGIPSDAIPIDSEVGHLIETYNDRIRLTREGRRLANQVIVRIDPSQVGLKKVQMLQALGPWEH